MFRWSPITLVKAAATKGQPVKKYGKSAGGSASAAAAAAAAAAGSTVVVQSTPKSDKGQSVDARSVRSVEPPAAKELAAAGKARRAAGKLRFDAYKAGLQKVDKAHVEQVIQEASKGSAFYQKEQRKEEARREKIDAALKKAEEYKALPQAQKQAIKAKVDEMERQFEATRDVRRRFIHVDMDMFYAAVEEKKNPQLRDVPFGVGSLQMLATTNYIARQYGVRSGMPGFIGKRLCPDLLIVRTDFTAYRREAATAHSIAARYDPEFVSLGLDELTMDVTNYLKEFPYLTAAQIATDFRDEVFAKTQLSCSGGIAPTPTLAKIASNVNKPNGQHEITLLDRDDFLRYVKDIPLRKIPGIGYAQESMLNALGIKTCGDLLKQKYMLAYLFKEKTFEHYLAVGLGLMGNSAHKQHEVRQSIGKEVSFSDPLASPDALSKLVRKLLEPCHVQCVREHLYAKQMRLVLKYRTYDTQQFSIALPRPTNDLKLWLEAAKKLVQPHLSDHAELRLVGVRLQKFVTEGSPELTQTFDFTKGSGDAPVGGRGSKTTTTTTTAAAEHVTAEPVEVKRAGAHSAKNARPGSAAAKASGGLSDAHKLDAEDEDDHHRALDEKIDEDEDEEPPAAPVAARAAAPTHTTGGHGKHKAAAAAAGSSAYARYAARNSAKGAGSAGTGAGSSHGHVAKPASKKIKAAAEKTTKKR